MKIDIGQLEFIDETLRTILVETEERLEQEQTITSLYRMGDNGVHGVLPLRGVDWRCRDRAEGEKIAAMINAGWAYDPNRPEKQCCIPHGEGWNFHLHIQTHPNTRRVE